MTLIIDIYSDVICPWCYVGKHRLEKALKAVEGKYETRVTWRPFELNPEMPKEGLDRKTYRSAKFGSWEKSQALDAQVKDAGASEGIHFRHDLMERTPNTFDAHQLIWLAGREGFQTQVVDAVFRGYFVEGADVGDRETLIRIASAVGMDEGRVKRFFETDEGSVAVHEEEKKARALGITGVPYFVFNNQLSVSGAQKEETFIGAFKQAREIAIA